MGLITRMVRAWAAGLALLLLAVLVLVPPAHGAQVGARTPTAPAQNAPAVSISIGVSPPSSVFPSLSIPPIPTVSVCIGPGGNSWQSCLTLPNFGALPAWILSCIVAVVAWLFDAILFATNWAVYLIVAALLSGVDLGVNGILAAGKAYWTVASAASRFTGPFAPLTGAVFLAGMVLLTVFAVLFLWDIAAKELARVTQEAEGPAEPDGSSDGGGSADEAAEVAA